MSRWRLPRLPVGVVLLAASCAGALRQADNDWQSGRWREAVSAYEAAVQGTAPPGAQ